MVHAPRVCRPPVGPLGLGRMPLPDPPPPFSAPPPFREFVWNEHRQAIHLGLTTGRPPDGTPQPNIPVCVPFDGRRRSP